MAYYKFTLTELEQFEIEVDAKSREAAKRKLHKSLEVTNEVARLRLFGYDIKTVRGSRCIAIAEGNHNADL